MILKQAIEQEDALFLPQYLDKFPDKWDSFIKYVDYCYKQDWIQQTEEEVKSFMMGGRVRKGLLQIWGFVTMFAENPANRSDMFDNLDLVIERIKSDYDQNEYLSSFAILNLSNAENVTNRHNDITHNMYVQCIGSVTWKIYDSISSTNYIEYQLKPGDAIWVPAGVSHEVVALEPRAAITITFKGKE